MICVFSIQGDHFESRSLAGPILKIGHCHRNRFLFEMFEKCVNFSCFSKYASENNGVICPLTLELLREPGSEDRPP